MASNNWKTVTFSEGAPLDPNDLNQLQVNLSNVFTTSTSLLNATVDASGKNKVALVDCGTVEIPLSGTANLPSAPKTVTLNSSFTPGSPISFVASVGEDLKKEYGVISVSSRIDIKSLVGTILISSNLTNKSTITINWIATQLKDV